MAEVQGETDSKEQLQLRVEARMKALRGSLAQAGGPNSTTERGRALVVSLNKAQRSISHGWERFGDKESAELTEWLASTEELLAAGGVPAQRRAK